MEGKILVVITVLIFKVQLIMGYDETRHNLCTRWRSPPKFVRPSSNYTGNSTRRWSNINHSYSPNNNIKNLDNNFILHILKHKLKLNHVPKIPTTTSATTPDCFCVPWYQCDSNNTIISDGIGIIDVRIRRCTGDLEVCCKPPQMKPTTLSTQPPTLPPTSPPTTLPPTSPPTSPPTTLPPTSPPTTLPPTTLPPTLPPTTLPPFPTLPPLRCMCVQIYQCGSDGFIITSGSGIIDPRQTSFLCSQCACEAPLVCCRIPPNSNQIVYPTSLTSIPTSPTTFLTPLIFSTQTSTIPPRQTLPPTLPTSSSTLLYKCVPISQCDQNGFIIVSGAGNIDPRYPARQISIVDNECGENQVRCYLPANGQDSIAFPNVPSFPSIDPRANLTVKNPGTPKACKCVKSSECQVGSQVQLDATGFIDPRFRYCLPADQVCCKLDGIIQGAISTTLTSTTVNTFLPASNLIVNRFDSTASAQPFCGVKGPKCTTENCIQVEGQTYFGEFPWMVALIVKPTLTGINEFLCGASMINNRAVLTAAHCVLNRKPGPIIARFGEWDTSETKEPLPYQESIIEAIITHPQYYSGGLYNDIAVLILESPVTYAVNVMPACMPTQEMIFKPGTRCWATGWGRDAFQGKYQTLLKKIDLPLIDRAECQSRLRTTRLGQYFHLHPSFLCAGGEENKDTCAGDGGGPLLCSISSGQFVQVGIVSWGIGCGESQIPAVYTDVVKYRSWIDQQLANYGVL